jgi:hypothetical protein
MLATRTTECRQITVAMALRLAPGQMQSVQDALGSGFTVEDIHSAPRDSAMVVIPPCSASTMAAVLRDFPAALVLVVEANLPGTAGPIGRALAGGAAAYAGSTGPAGLAETVRWAQEGLAA